MANLNQNILSFEAFFKLNTNYLLETRNEKTQWHNLTECQVKTHDNFYKFLHTIEVSTELNERDLVCSNYAKIIDEFSHPVLVINFIYDTSIDIAFYTQWFNPLGIIL